MTRYDTKSLTDLYEAIYEKKNSCKCNKTDCTCNNKPASKSSKPDYLDVNKNGNKTELFKKALQDKKNIKENSKFKNLYLSIFNESQERS